MPVYDWYCALLERPRYRQFTINRPSQNFTMNQ